MGLKKMFLLIMLASFVFQAFGQLSLRECVNIMKGIPKTRWSIDTVSEKEKVGVALKMLAGDIVDGTLKADSLPNYILFHPDSNQIKIWCKRILDGGGMVERMMSSIVTSNAWDIDGDTIPDAVIKTTCRKRVCPFAVFDLR